MQSVLISSKDQGKAREQSFKIANINGVDKIDVSIIESQKAIGIPDVREIQNKIFLAPIRSDIKTIIVNTKFGITPEAQSALLKTLEEPPGDTIIILETPNIDEILPTIISRCKVIEIKNGEKKTSKNFDILKEGIGEKLKLAQDLSKDRQEALDYIEDLILNFRKELLKNPKKEKINTIKSLQKNYSIIKSTNVNLRLALENLLISL